MSKQNMNKKLLFPLISGLIVGAIMGGAGFWITVIALIGGGPGGLFFYVTGLFFIVGFILGYFMVWIYHLINTHLKTPYILPKMFLALICTLILAVMLDIPIRKLIGVSLGVMIDLFKTIDWDNLLGNLLTPLFK